MKTTLLFPVIFIVVFLADVYAQADVNVIIDEIIEAQSFDRDGAVSDYQYWVEQLSFLSENRIALNSCDHLQLAAIPFLTAYQIENILQYRRKSGKIVSLYELQWIDGLDAVLIRWLAPFVELKIEDKQEGTYRRRWWRHQMIMRTEKSLHEGRSFLSLDTTSGFLGDDFRHYFRYIAKSKEIEVGVTAEKDPGEPFFRGKNMTGFDFYSGHLYLEGIRRLKCVRKLAIGDYVIQQGQGLNIWKGFSMGKNSDGIRRYPRGIQPYRSAGEIQFFRGIAVDLSLKPFRGYFFSSFRHLDGVLNKGEEHISISSISQTGYHRTLAEMQRKNNLRENLFGGYISYRYQLFYIGLSSYFVQYQYPIMPPQRIYNEYAFRGKTNFVKGLDFSLALPKGSLFGEVSFDGKNWPAWLLGTEMRLHSRLSLHVLYRNYHLKYNNTMSMAYGEYKGSKNEYGLYGSFNFELSSSWDVLGYFDFFGNPGVRYQLYASAMGREAAIQFNYRPNTETMFYMKYFMKYKMQNGRLPGLGSGSQQIHILPMQKRYLSFYFNRILENIDLKSRLVATYYRKEPKKSSGYVLSQDVGYRFSHLPLHIQMRLAFFHTDDYFSRVQMYEPDMMYVISFPAYYGHGLRSCLMIKYQWKSLAFWWRGGYMIKGEETVADDDLIPSRVSSGELKMQVYWTF